MKIELDPTEVRVAVEAHASHLVLPGRAGEVAKVTIHTAGGATVEFNDAPHLEPPVPEPPVDGQRVAEAVTVKEAETKARKKAAATAGKGKS